MFESNRDRHSASLEMLIILGLALVFTVPMYWLGNFDGVEASKTKAYAANYRQQANDKREECLILSEPKAIFECAAEAEKSKRERENAEYDLQAQEEMARWARWLWFVALLQTIISGAGILYIKRTLSINREATDAALRAAVATEVSIKETKVSNEQQLRAYVSVEPKTGFLDLLPPALPKITLNIVNHGQTPAYKLTQTSAIAVFPHPLPANYNFPSLPAVWDSQATIFPNAKVDHHELRVAAQSLTQNEIAQILAGSSRIYVYGYVAYFDIFGKPQSTKFCRSAVLSPSLVGILTGQFQNADVLMEPSTQHQECT